MRIFSADHCGVPSSTVTELRRSSAAPSIIGSAAHGHNSSGGTVVPYDFRRPAKLPREHVRGLQMACDTFGRRLTTLLTSSLRQVCEVTVREVTQQNYDEYIGSLPSQTLAMPLHAAPIGTGVVELALPVALAAERKGRTHRDRDHRAIRLTRGFEPAMAMRARSMARLRSRNGDLAGDPPRESRRQHPRRGAPAAAGVSGVTSDLQ